MGVVVGRVAVAVGGVAIAVGGVAVAIGGVAIASGIAEAAVEDLGVGLGLGVSGPLAVVVDAAVHKGVAVGKESVAQNPHD